MQLRPALLATVVLPILASPVIAAPAVVADIAPVQSLVARVMAGVGEPGVIVPPGASPHSLAMKPSQSALLDQAEVVFWVGPELEPWLEKPLDALAGGATVVALFDSASTRHLAVRQGATFEAHHHGDEAGGAEGEAHGHAEAVEQGAAGDQAQADQPGQDHAGAGGAEADHAGDGASDGDHADEAGHDHAGHDHAHHHGGEDPHAWLDPVNAQAWLGTIAATLSQADPANAARYAANAEAAKGELDRLRTELTAELAPVAGTPFVVFHDAYQYFEDRFGISAAGSISLADGSAPGPARLAQVQQKVRGMKIACALSEPQFDPALIDTVFEGMEVRTGTLDPLGATLSPGPELYPQLLRRLAQTLKDCAG